MWPNFILIVLRIQKNKYKCNFHYARKPMMTSSILKFVDFTKTETSHCFFSKYKNSLIKHQGLDYSKKQFCSRGNLLCFQPILSMWAAGFLTAHPILNIWQNFEYTFWGKRKEKYLCIRKCNNITSYSRKCNSRKWQFCQIKNYRLTK